MQARWFTKGDHVSEARHWRRGQRSASMTDDLSYETVVADAEARLKASEDRFRLLAENAHDFIFSYRLPPDRGFDYVSPACQAITGYSPAELYADPDLIFDVLEPQYVEMMREI